MKQANNNVYNMRLQNVVMQLRMVCSYPTLFERPRMHRHVMDKELVDASGKLMVLERLAALFANTRFSSSHSSSQCSMSSR